MQNSEIGHRIKTRRIELGLTQAQVGQMANLSTSQICYLESGKRTPSAHIINTLSEILKCSADWLIKGIITDNRETDAPSQTEPPSESAKSTDIKRMLDMYLYIDKVDQEEICLLLELKYRKKEKEWKTLISSLLKEHTDSSTL